MHRGMWPVSILARQPQSAGPSGWPSPPEGSKLHFVDHPLAMTSPLAWVCLRLVLLIFNCGYPYAQSHWSHTKYLAYEARMSPSFCDFPINPRAIYKGGRIIQLYFCRSPPREKNLKAFTDQENLTHFPDQSEKHYPSPHRNNAMCFYGYKEFRCSNCGELLWATTLKKRDCRKRSCNKIVPEGRPIKVDTKSTYEPSHSCYFPLMTETEARRAGQRGTNSRNTN